MPQALTPLLLGVGILLGGAVVARLLTRWTGWGPAGGVALIVAAPLAPHVTIASSLSADDLLPLLGLGLLAWRRPVPRLTGDRLLRWILVAMAVATLARIGTALVNGDPTHSTLTQLVQAIARPLVLVGVACYVGATAPERDRLRFVSMAMGAIGTFEAAFSLIGFVFGLPGHAGIDPTRVGTSLYGVCPGRVSGTLGLSANHIGALFVLTIPVSAALALHEAGWRRWAWVGATGLQSAALVLTFTRSSILIAGILTLAFLVYERRFVVGALVVATTAAILVIAVGVSCTGSPVAGRITDRTDRLALWYAAARIAIDHPLFGVGLDRMNEVVNANPQRYKKTPFGTVTSSAHNTILLAAAETGIAGGLAILAVNVGVGLLALRLAWRGRRRERELLLAAALALAGYLAQGMVNNLFSVPGTSVLFACVIGAFAVARGEGGEGPYTPRKLDDRGPDGDV